MEMLEDMEITNPHMSEEKLEELKQKHRAAENRAIMKADMDYLKGIIRYRSDKSINMTGTGIMGAGLSNPAAAPSFLSVNAEGTLPPPEASAGVSFNIQI